MIPRPESRITNLEGRAALVEARILELASDQAEELKAIRQELQKLNDGMNPSFDQNGQRLSAIEMRLDRIEGNMKAMEKRLLVSIDAIKESIFDGIRQLLQQKGQ